MNEGDLSRVTSRLDAMHEKLDTLNLKQEITNQKLDGVNKRLDISNGRLAKHDETIKNIEIEQNGFGIIEKEVEDLRNNNAWVVRLIIGAIIVSILAMVIK